MTEREAISVLYEQFVAPSGFLPRLRRGEEFDRVGLQAVWQALETLKHAWANCGEVPRDALLALSYFDEALPTYFDLYPVLKDELINLHLDLIVAIGDLFDPRIIPQETWEDDEEISFDFFGEWTAETSIPDRSLSEEEAHAVLRKHLYEDGLVVALRTRAGSFNGLGVAKAWRLLHMALDTLQPIWSAHLYIAKDVASGLVQIRELVTNGWAFYEGVPTLQERLLWLADDLGDRVQRCLHGNH